MKDLVFATHNAHKLEEIRAILKEYNILGLNDINCHTDIIEDARTLEGNAIIKANFVTNNYNINCFADDTGLEVEALDGAPGVYSARYAGENATDEDRIKKLLGEMEGVEDRRAKFVTSVAVIFPDGKEITAMGEVNGTILNEPQGNNGFGYNKNYGA